MIYRKETDQYFQTGILTYIIGPWIYNQIINEKVYIAQYHRWETRKRIITKIFNTKVPCKSPAVYSLSDSVFMFIEWIQKIADL